MQKSVKALKEVNKQEKWKRFAKKRKGSCCIFMQVSRNIQNDSWNTKLNKDLLT